MSDIEMPIMYVHCMCGCSSMVGDKSSWDTNACVMSISVIDHAVLTSHASNAPCPSPTSLPNHVPHPSPPSNRMVKTPQVIGEAAKGCGTWSGNKLAGGGGGDECGLS